MLVYVVQTELEELVHVASTVEGAAQWVKEHADPDETFQVTAVTVDSHDSPPDTTTYDAAGPVVEEDDDDDD